MAEVVVPKVEVVPCLPSFQVVLPFQVGEALLPFQVGEVVLHFQVGEVVLPFQVVVPFHQFRVGEMAPFQVVVGEVVRVELVGEVAGVGFQVELVRGGES